MKADTTPILFLIAISILTGLAQIVMRWGGKAAALQPARDWLDWLWVSRWWIVGLMASWLGGLGYALSLRKINLSLAMAVYSGLAYLISVVGGFALLRESMNPLQIAGVAIILAGMLMLSIH